MEPPDPVIESPAICYFVDPLDRIVGVNEAWTDFAMANGVYSVLPNRIVGSCLWNHISNDTVLEVYRLMLRRVRAGRRLAFSYRCDSPVQRMKCEMTLELVEAGNVRFSSQLSSAQEREWVPLLDPASPRDGRMMVVCSWCQRVSEPGGIWLPVEEAVARHSLMEASSYPEITHGMCDECLRKYVSELG